MPTLWSQIHPEHTREAGVVGGSVAIHWRFLLGRGVDAVRVISVAVSTIHTGIWPETLVG